MKAIRVVSANSYDRDYGRKYFVTIYCDTPLYVGDNLIFSSSAFTAKLGDETVYSHPIFEITEIKKIINGGNKSPKKNCKKAKKGDKIIATVVSDVPAIIEVGNDIYKLIYTYNECSSHTYNHVYEAPKNDMPNEYDRDYWHDQKAVNNYKKTHTTTNEYTDEPFKADEKKNCDHISPLKTQFEKLKNNKRAAYVSNEEKKAILNSVDNLAMTDEHTNKSKGALTNEAYIKRENLKDTPKGKKMCTKQQESEADINSKINKRYGKEAAKEIGINVGINAAIDGVSETIHQMHEVKHNGKPVKQAVKDGAKKIGKDAVMATLCAAAIHSIDLLFDTK